MRLLPEPVGVFNDHVRTGEDLEQRFLLGWVELEARSAVQARNVSRASSRPR